MALVDDAGACEVLDDLAALFADKKTRATAAGFFQQFEQIPAVGPMGLGSGIYHKVDDQNEIYEFIKRDHRLLCFEADSRIVVCSHVMRKKQQKTSPKDRRRAAAFRTAYLVALQQGELVVVEN